MTGEKLQKPFLKWVGGKTQIINNVINKFPKEINNYHELFLGGGSVLMALLSLQKQKKIVVKNKVYAYDLNLALINTFKQIQNNYKAVIVEVLKLKEEFKNIEINTLKQRGAPKDINESNYKTTREHYYYWIRSKFNACDKNNFRIRCIFYISKQNRFSGNV